MTTRLSLIVSPKVRTIRTIIQTLVAVAAAVPAAIALLPIENTHALWVVGISGAFTIIASAAQNAWEAARDQTFKPGDDTGQVSLAMVVIVGLVIVVLLMATGAISIRA